MFGYEGFTDNKIELDPEDDAAYVNWGSMWRTPSLEQIQELCDSCTWQYTQQNGMNGHLVTGPNGNTIFLPATGFYNEGSVSDVGKSGNYTSRTITVTRPVQLPRHLLLEWRSTLLSCQRESLPRPHYPPCACALE